MRYMALNKPVEPSAEEVVSFNSILLVILNFGTRKNADDSKVKSSLNIVLQHDSGLFVVMFAHEQF